jgi:hypothetical protein
MALYMFIYPVFLCFVNDMGVADRLSSFQARLVSVKATKPHMTLQLDDGSQIDAEFISSLIGHERVTVVGDYKKLLKSVNCIGVFEAKSINFSVPHRTVIYAMNCGDVKISAKDSIADFQLGWKFESRLLLGGMGVLGFIFFIIVRSGRKGV